MPDISRRAALQTVATAGALLSAGCAGEASRSHEVPSRGEPITDIEVAFARDVDGESIFAPDDEPDTSTATGHRDREGNRPINSVEYLVGTDDRDGLTFSETAAGEALRSFVDGTDFSTESIYLLERSLGECYTLALVNVVRDDDGGISADFCRQLRPADVACEAKTLETVGVAIRLPFAGDSSGGLGTGMSSRCEPEPVIASEPEVGQ